MYHYSKNDFENYEHAYKVNWKLTINLLHSANKNEIILSVILTCIFGLENLS